MSATVYYTAACVIAGLTLPIVSDQVRLEGVSWRVLASGALPSFQSPTTTVLLAAPYLLLSLLGLSSLSSGAKVGGLAAVLAVQVGGAILARDAPDIFLIAGIQIVVAIPIGLATGALLKRLRSRELDLGSRNPES